MGTLMFGILALGAILIGGAYLAGDAVGADEGCRGNVIVGIFVLVGLALTAVLLANGRL